jgi:NADH-quinone oxidoreductase subunit G
LLDGTYRHQARPWELAQTISTCSYCSDGCEMSLGSRAGELMRIVARDRYVNGHNGEFLCIKGRFGHPFVNHEARLRTPLIRHNKGGKLIPATWDDAISHVAEKLKAVTDGHGPGALGVVGSPRITNEANYALYKFATEVVGTNNYTATDAFSLKPFFNNLGAALATHRDLRYAKTILLIGGEPEELQPLTARQIRQAVSNGAAKLIIVNSVPIRLVEHAAQFIHIRPGTENAAVWALANSSNEAAAAQKLGIEANELTALRQTIAETEGDLVIMFGGELNAAAQVVVAQLANNFRADNRRVLLHPLPIFNNSIGAHDMGLMNGAMSAGEMLDAAGSSIRALYVAGSFLPAHFRGREEALDKLDFLVVQELFETDTTAFADVVLPAASFAEVDGTFTNNDGLVQRVRQSIPPVHQAKPDWMITAALAAELGKDFGFQMSASAVFREIAERIPAYSGLRYPVLKEESNPVQARYKIVEPRDLSSTLNELRQTVEALPDTGDKLTVTPKVGHELFKIGTLTDKVAQFHLLAAGNPRPDTLRVSPLYQITVDAKRERDVAFSGD